MNNVAIFIMSDPNNGEEALGRAFNGLAAAYDIKQANGEVSVTFQGAGVRWANLLTNQDHPLHGLYKLVKNDIQGVSCGCADVFCANDDIDTQAFPRIKENMLPGTSGVGSFAKHLKFGTTVLTF